MLAAIIPYLMAGGGRTIAPSERAMLADPTPGIHQPNAIKAILRRDSIKHK